MAIEFHSTTLNSRYMNSSDNENLPKAEGRESPHVTRSTDARADMRRHLLHLQSS